MNNLREIAQNFKTSSEYIVLENEPLSKHCSFKLGGVCELFVEPLTSESFIDALNFCVKENLEYFVLGGGTNIVFPDGNFDKIVISTNKLNRIEKVEGGEATFSKDQHGGLDTTATLDTRDANSRTDQHGGLDCDDSKLNSQPIHATDDAAFDDSHELVKCDSGTSINTFVNWCLKNGFIGVEEFAGLPGTVGGACFMNARCFNKEISEIVYEIEYLKQVESTSNVDADSRDVGSNANSQVGVMGNVDADTRDNGGHVAGATSRFVKASMKFNKSDWDYKISPFINTRNIVLSATFKVKKATNAELQEATQKADDYKKQRIEKGHYKFPCAGSVFKNNKNFGEPTGAIVDKLGLKGKSIGGAQVATFHGNIIVNTGGAKSSDVKELVEFIKKEAKEKRGFDLEEEIIFI